MNPDRTGSESKYLIKSPSVPSFQYYNEKMQKTFA